MVQLGLWLMIQVLVVNGTRLNLWDFVVCDFVIVLRQGFENNASLWSL